MIPDSLSLGEFVLLVIVWAVFGLIGWAAIGLAGLTIAIPFGLVIGALVAMLEGWILQKCQEPMRRFVDGRPEGFKVGDALLILDHDFAIDQGSLTVQVGASIDNPAIWSGPISAGAWIGSDPALVDDDQGSIAVILDLVNPTSPRRWLRDRGRDFQLDKAQRGHIRLYLAGAPAIRKMSKSSPQGLSVNRLVACGW
jgi:hypothetical protein